MEKILFVLKRPSDKEDYSTNKHTGLFNSCVFLVELLNDIGFEAILDFAVDGNYIWIYFRKFYNFIWCNP